MHGRKNIKLKYIFQIIIVSCHNQGRSNGRARRTAAPRSKLEESVNMALVNSGFPHEKEFLGKIIRSLGTPPQKCSSVLLWAAKFKEYMFKRASNYWLARGVHKFRVGAVYSLNRASADRLSLGRIFCHSARALVCVCVCV